MIEESSRAVVGVYGESINQGAPKHDYLKDLNNCVLTPRQSRICIFNYSKFPDKVTINIQYESIGNTYSEKITTNLKAATSMPASKYATKGENYYGLSTLFQTPFLRALLRNSAGVKYPNEE